VGQLGKRNKNGLTAWSTGYAEFGPQETSIGKIMVGVKCQIENLRGQDVGFLDTGAELPLIGGELARWLGNYPIEKEDVKIVTRFGELSGNVVRMTITLVADHGENLPIESSVLLAEEWDGPIVLGYDGFLNRLRFAFDPGLYAPGERIFYFGKDANLVG